MSPYSPFPLVFFRSSQATPWPKPQTFTNGSASSAVVLDPNLAMNTTSQSGVLQRAFARLQAALKGPQLAPTPYGYENATLRGTVSFVVVQVASDDETLNDSTNETYVLSVSWAGLAAE